ncbi:MAG: orotidine 5'-phosphate decarboxylase [Candidatus Lokiarchaeota archaeon]|jgi:bifunctional enzyme Fae/Hps|nr:orotidine 5'-phosphate decarboxylase [Candidatus Lokiarchaeota archaeon]
MSRTFLNNQRYIQIAFNHTASDVLRILPQIPYDPRIIIEAGTPYIKREGISGIRLIRRLWRGLVVADLKVTDGANEEVRLAYSVGANAVTAAGTAPEETLDFFDEVCEQFGILSMIDMLGQENPLRKLMPLKYKPKAVVIHKGRDEEANPRSIIRYKDINKVRSKYGVLISVAGGLNQDSVRKAYFNGADIAVLNIVKSSDANIGLVDTMNFRSLIPSILKEV